MLLTCLTYRQHTPLHHNNHGVASGLVVELPKTCPRIASHGVTSALNMNYHTPNLPSPPSIHTLASNNHGLYITSAI